MVALIVAFFSTNVDGFACFAAALALNRPRSRARTIGVAAFAFSLLLACSFAAMLAIGRTGISPAWFGLVPAGIGIARLARLTFGARAASDNDWISAPASIFSIVLATGIDNVAVYAPLFALSPLRSSLLIAAAYLGAWTAGCTILARVAPNASRVHAFKRHLEPAVAILFIAVGAEIVATSWRV
jgi:cadmium resistance protein CadD (predicted permease)